MIISNMQLITRTHSSTTTPSRRARRLAQRSTLLACTVAALAAPGVASAADTVVAPDPAAHQVSALDGTVVWVSGAYGDQVLMQRTPAGVIARVKDAPRAGYGSIDLGRDRKGKLVLTYARCGKNDCTAKRDDLDGKRASFKNLTPKRCRLNGAPAVWGTRLAYGLYCRTPKKRADVKRSGLYVKNGSGSPRRLRLPSDVSKYFATGIGAVDLRGTRVAAIAWLDSSAYAFTETVNGNGMRSLNVAASEGDSERTATGVSLGKSNAMWTLSTSEYPGEPNRANIRKVSRTCYRSESLVNPSGPNQEQGFPATDLAVDHTTLYLVVPGTGIVKHDFAPQQGWCTKP